MIVGRNAFRYPGLWLPWCLRAKKAPADGFGQLVGPSAGDWKAWQSSPAVSPPDPIWDPRSNRHRHDSPTPQKGNSKTRAEMPPKRRPRSNRWGAYPEPVPVGSTAAAASPAFLHGERTRRCSPSRLNSGSVLMLPASQFNVDPSATSAAGAPPAADDARRRPVVRYPR